MNQPNKPLMGLARLMRLAHSGAELDCLGDEFIKRGEQNDANALLDLSILLQLKQLPEIALGIQNEALAISTLYHLPSENEQIRLLALMGRGDTMANTPLEFLVENSDISLDLLYLGEGLPLPEMVPDHDVAFVAVGESEQNLQLLRDLANIVPHWPRPVLNKPEKIARISRDQSAVLLQSAPGIEIPAAARASREQLLQIAHNEMPPEAISAQGYPLIVRPLGSHAGKGLEKVNDAAELQNYLQRIDVAQYYVSPFVDYRSADGFYRKYRIAIIDGRAFACHMGISTHWMIHYLNASMEESAEKREMEAAFMANFDQDFAVKHRRGIESLNEIIGLDYLVADCAETVDGKLLIFELDSGAVVHDMDPPEIFPYKGPQMRKTFAAFRQMLEKARAPK